MEWHRWLSCSLESGQKKAEKNKIILQWQCSFLQVISQIKNDINCVHGHLNELNKRNRKQKKYENLKVVKSILVGELKLCTYRDVWAIISLLHNYMYNIFLILLITKNNFKSYEYAYGYRSTSFPSATTGYIGFVFIASLLNQCKLNCASYWDWLCSLSTCKPFCCVPSENHHISDSLKKSFFVELFVLFIIWRKNGINFKGGPNHTAT